MPRSPSLISRPAVPPRPRSRHRRSGGRRRRRRRKTRPPLLFSSSGRTRAGASRIPPRAHPRSRPGRGRRASARTGLPSRRTPRGLGWGPRTPPCPPGRAGKERRVVVQGGGRLIKKEEPRQEKKSRGDENKKKLVNSKKASTPSQKRGPKCSLQGEIRRQAGVWNTGNKSSTYVAPLTLSSPKRESALQARSRGERCGQATNLSHRAPRESCVHTYVLMSIETRWGHSQPAAYQERS